MPSATKMFMAACLMLALWCCPAPSFAGAGSAPGARPPELGPKDFTVLIPMRLSASAPMYRLTLPLEVYEESRFLLRDLRVFNSLGKPEPFMISAAGAGAPKEEEGEERAYPCFMQRAGLSGDGDIVLVGEDGRPPKDNDDKGDRRATSRTARRVSLGVLADFGVDRPAFSRLRVVPEAASGIKAMMSVRLYASKDLRRWDNLSRRDTVTLGGLSMNGQTLELFDLPLGVDYGRYLLILPPTDTELFPVREIRATEQAAAVSPVQSSNFDGQWDDKAEGYGYMVPRALPVIRVEPLRDEDNYLLRGELLTSDPQTAESRGPGFRGPDARPGWRNKLGSTFARKDRALIRPGATVWRSRARINSYSVTVRGTRQRSASLYFDRTWLNPPRGDAALPLKPQDDGDTLLLKPQGSDWPGPPTLAVTWAEQQLFFMAGGPGPYVLAVGGEQARSRDEAAFAPDMLAVAAPAELLPKEAQTQEKPVAGAETETTAAPGATRWLLWGILLLGAACMAFMALQLLRKPAGSNPR